MCRHGTNVTILVPFLTATTSRGAITMEQLSTIIGESPAAQRLRAQIHLAAQRDVSVLLHGPTGAGKDVAARAIHGESSRSKGPYVAVNCGALPEHLVVSELFGFEKGAFTGAVAARAGKFEQAHGGTLFLDEIGEMPLPAQTALLRVLETRAVERIGASRSLPVDVRIVCATNRDLAAEARAGRFRLDLFYRLNVFPIEVPGLRDRGADVILLLEHFLATQSMGRPPRFSAEDHARLQAHDWPGNVRELRNLVERACVVFDGGAVDLDQLGGALARDDGDAVSESESLWAAAGCVEAAAAEVPANGLASPAYALPTRLRPVDYGVPLDSNWPTSPEAVAERLLAGGYRVDMPGFLKSLEKILIDTAIARCNGSVSAASRLLCTNRTTIIAKIRRRQPALPAVET